MLPGLWRVEWYYIWAQLPFWSRAACLKYGTSKKQTGKWAIAISSWACHMHVYEIHCIYFCSSFKCKLTNLEIQLKYMLHWWCTLTSLKVQARHIHPLHLLSSPRVYTNCASLFLTAVKMWHSVDLRTSLPLQCFYLTAQQTADVCHHNSLS